MILILDFGSQYTQLIARRVREAQVYCEILPCTVSVDEVRARGAEGIILSGGPGSIYVESAPQLAQGILGLKRSGTNPNYEGLWETVREFKVPTAEAMGSSGSSW